MSVNENKEKFISLIRRIERDGSDIEGFLSMLENSDFYVAPASTQYNWSFEGGLCAHSMCVYDLLCKIISVEYGDIYSSPYSMDSIILVSLLHDLGKINFYEKYVKNEKIYSPVGKKSDEMGRFDWVSSSAFKVKDSSSRFTLGTLEENSLYIAQGYFPLSVEETSAILNLRSTKDRTDYEQLYSFSKYELSLYLTVADMISTFKYGKDEE